MEVDFILGGQKEPRAQKRGKESVFEVGNGDEKKLAGLNMALCYSNPQSLLKSY